jgi:hypothetical protein
MRGQMPVALFAILLGAVDAAAGIQELVYLGVLRSETEPLVEGALGTVGAAMLLAAGIALLISSRLTGVLVSAAAYVSVPVFIWIGVIKHYPAWPSTVLGIAYPLFLYFFYQRSHKSAEAASRS